MDEHVTRHYVDPETPLYEATIRATGIVPDPYQPPVVVIQKQEAPDDRPVLERHNWEVTAEIELPRPAGAAAVVAISEPTGVMPRPRKDQNRKKGKGR